MECKCKVQDYGRNKTLLLNCYECVNTASLANSNCFSSILKKLELEKNLNNIIFSRDFGRVHSKEDVDIIYDLVEFYDKYKYAKIDLCKRCRNKFRFQELFKEKFASDPLLAYKLLMAEISMENKCQFCSEKYGNFLKELKNDFEKTKLIKSTVQYRDKNLKIKEIYHLVFKPNLKPSFITSYVELKSPNDSKVIERYAVGPSIIEIHKLNKRPDMLYHINAPEFSLNTEEIKIINFVLDELLKKEIESNLLNPETARGTIRTFINEILAKNTTKKISADRLNVLSEILERYTAGYGLLEIPLRDTRIQDVYIDSPGDFPLHIYHEEYEGCVTNITLSEEDLEKLSTRLRALSGRPFDESTPALHCELKDLGIRVCGICPPLTFNGTGFAFRKHRLNPWTLTKFILNGTLNFEAAGLLSFLIDSQCSILITGPRSSGKTSLLQSLLNEFSLNNRIIIMEDTPEIPVQLLKERGFKIQHIKLTSSFEKGSYELTAKEALRTALRLGESVMVIGEVRGPEAKALFEAMRIGATGNCVLGTIHGSSPYDVWDRITNDLGVPSTSFKATDVIISTAGIRFGEDVRRHKRIIGITELKKQWEHDPSSENGFFNLMEYDASKDKLILNKKWFDSELLKKIARNKGMSIEDLFNSIDIRTKMKYSLVYYGLKYKKPEFFDLEFNVKSNNEFLRLLREYDKKVNYPAVYKDWIKWLQNESKK